ncbi:MAG: hypothetical protein CMJ18_27655 [Phycisphaeraceae bacterium]|nr:hypothetical protein [Phycisphaeraceae bacterium]
MKTVILNIISTAYSGSTWVNMMLGSHSQSFSVGEMKRIFKAEQAQCSIHGSDCPIWSRFDLHADESPFAQIARLAGRRVLVVNNARKQVPAHDDAALHTRFIHLIRDGRAVVASYLRKSEGESAFRAARWWRHGVRRNRRFLNRHPAGDRIDVCYERLCREPEPTLRDICRFLDLDFEPSMLEYWKHVEHFIGGNRGTLLHVARSHGLELPAPTRETVGDAPRKTWDLGYYERQTPRTFSDERWKRELTGARLRVFDLVAGRLNRKLGYDAAQPSPGRRTVV